MMRGGFVAGDASVSMSIMAHGPIGCPSHEGDKVCCRCPDVCATTAIENVKRKIKILGTWKITGKPKGS